LLVEFRVTEGQLDGFLDLLFLDIKASDVSVGHVGLLSHLHHLNGCIGVRGKDINDSLRALVNSYTSIRSEVFSVQS